ncbi:anaerobic benzoate catabolism transcriptional regulator [mine drainage metagenome]|uniref:Anaerobic benzoate catabolism transcriptional regulator n=1 Tax=mine drainage metagenome TaxID=410659 RepID=A0A1J5Q5E2_9ZZZZ
MQTEDILTLRQPAKVRFGIKLRLAREGLQLSQELLADMAGMHRTYIGQVERGERNISVDNMEKLAAAVNLPLWEMLRVEA